MRTAVISAYQTLHPAASAVCLQLYEYNFTKKNLKYTVN